VIGDYILLTLGAIAVDYVEDLISTSSYLGSDSDFVITFYGRLLLVFSIKVEPYTEL